MFSCSDRSELVAHLVSGRIEPVEVALLIGLSNSAKILISKATWWVIRYQMILAIWWAMAVMALGAPSLARKRLYLSPR